MTVHSDPEIKRLFQLDGFGSRTNEILSVKRKDISLTYSQILVTFNIQKNSKRFKICPVFETKSGFKAKFCKEYRADLQYEVIHRWNEEFIVTKRKTLRNKFAKHVVNWLIKFDHLTETIDDNFEAWFFPSLQVCFCSAYFKLFSKKHMTLWNLSDKENAEICKIPC